MRVGVLTGGGDCPGLNAVIRAVVRKGVEVHGWEFVGFRNGWQGPLTGDSFYRSASPTSRTSSPAGAPSCGRRGRTRTRSTAASTRSARCSPTRGSTR